MKNINYNKCDNCGEKNPLFVRNCTNCSHSLREKVVNINLWETIFKLFHAPIKTLKNIVYAEHKNFITFILVLIAVKLYTYSIIVQSAFGQRELTSEYLLLNSVIVTLFYILVFLVFSFLFKYFLKFIKIKNRFRDNIVIFSYSFTPLLLTSIIMWPMEYAVFGRHWFTFNPSPFIIKNTQAYLFSSIEGLMLLWSLFILFLGMYLQSGKILISVIILLFFVLILGGMLFYLPYILF